jgi:hypothetical protein
MCLPYTHTSTREVVSIGSNKGAGRQPFMETVKGSVLSPGKYIALRYRHQSGECGQERNSCSFCEQLEATKFELFTAKTGGTQR